MVRNYIRIGVRNLARNKVYTFINVTGLAIGLASFILIALYIFNETGYDTFYENAENIYRINTHVEVNGNTNNYPAAHYPAAFDMTSDYPEVENGTTMYKAFYLSNVLPKIKYKDNEFEERKFFLADSNFFSVFDFDFKYGERGKAFENSYSIVLTDEASHKYFGNENPIGKFLQFQDTVTFKVTGVLKPFRGKTHLNFDFVAHSKLLLNQLVGFRIDHAYVGLWYYSYITMQPGTSPAALQSKLPAFVKKYYPPRYTENNASLTLQNIRDIHLFSDFSTGDMSVNGDIGYVYTLGSIAVLVLIIACINFMNLSIARFANRGKEVGVRKVMGALKNNLVTQFLGESTLVALLSGIVSVVLVILFIPIFNALAGSSLSFKDLWNLPAIATIIGIIFLTGLIAGTYPAFVMAAFQPVKVLKGIHKASNAKFSLRKVLVIAQFSVSMILLIGTLVVADQLDFMRNKHMGFEKDQVLTIPTGSVTTMFRDYAVFKNKLLEVQGIQSVSNISHDLGQVSLPYFPMKVEGMDDEQMLPIMYVGFDFPETFKIEMKAGRFFSISNPSDSTKAFVINESAARALNWNDPLGKKITFGVGGVPDSEVIGVIKDFNFDPLRSKVGPLVIYFSGASGNIAVKMQAGDHQRTVRMVGSIWNELFPSTPFSYAFLNESLDKTYQDEEKLATVFKYFCVLAMLVAALGLFALASYSAEQRSKEIGVRKVLGASETGLVLLLYKEFAILIAIAFLIASPLAYYLFDQWLNHFAYRTSVSITTFGLTAFVISVIAFVTVGYQSIMAARTNPIKVLRSE